MKKARKILYIILFVATILLIGTVKSKAGYLNLNSLDFNVQINNDGSIDITETWDIRIKETNTLYKSFKTDYNKYSNITNVTVKDITNGRNNKFIKNNNWEYHVQKGYYYGTKNEEGDFEIGWGVGLDNSSATKKYEISYKVQDAITKYNDYSELYWQFVGKEFEINSNKITGTIYLPSNVLDKEDIKVWGHTEDLNGTIYVTDTNKFEFEINNFRSGRYVEVRTLFPTQLISNSGRIKNTDILQTAINEETKWANNANSRRERKEFFRKAVPIIIVTICLAINILLIIIYIKKAIKYYKKNKKLNKYMPTTKLEYYRDLPDENSTPGEALKTLDVSISTFTPMNFGKVFSATMLDLSLKGYLEIKQKKNQKGKDIIQIDILKESDNKIKSDESRILEFIKEASKGKCSITLKELENYIKNHSTTTDLLLKDVYGKVNKQLIDENIVDIEIQKEYKKYKESQTYYILSIIFLLCFTFIAFLIPVIIFVVNAILCGKVAKKLNVLTQKGIDMKEQWKGLKKYMEDFSILDRREVPELIIWEKYLVFATVFGIADKVIKQLKIVYPNLDEMTNGIATFTYMNLMINTDFSSSFTKSINSSISSAYSSGSGAGGGFSGGGGFGRRSEVAVAGR